MHQREHPKRVPFPATNRDTMSGDWGWRILSATIPRHRHASSPSSSIRLPRASIRSRTTTHTTHAIALATLTSPQPPPPLLQTPAHARIAVDRALAHPASTLTHASHPSFNHSFVSLLVYAYALIPNSFSMAARRPSMPVSLVISGVRLAAATGASTTGRSATGQYIWAKYDVFCTSSVD